MCRLSTDAAITHRASNIKFIHSIIKSELFDVRYLKRGNFWAKNLALLSLVISSPSEKYASVISFAHHLDAKDIMVYFIDNHQIITNNRYQNLFFFRTGWFA